jgi:hypothetical protein
LAFSSTGNRVVNKGNYVLGITFSFVNLTLLSLALSLLQPKKNKQKEAIVKIK